MWVKKRGSINIERRYGMISGTGHWRPHVCGSPPTDQHTKRIQHKYTPIPTGLFHAANSNVISQRCEDQLRVIRLTRSWKGECTRSLYLQEDLHYMLLQDTWGDQIVCKGMLILWQIKLTLLNTPSLTQVKFQHKKHFADADVILVNNGRQHYNTVGKYLESVISAKMMVSTLLSRDGVISAKQVVLSFLSLTEHLIYPRYPEEACNYFY